MRTELRSASVGTRLPVVSRPRTEKLKGLLGTLQEVRSSSSPGTTPSNTKVRLSPPSHRGNSSPSTRLLVVDDHAVVRHGVTGWLHTQTGFEVVGEAETAQEAIAQAILFRPDVVLLDVGLPGEGGLCAASRIVRTCPGTKVVAFSASADPVHVRGMLAAGATAYVLKTSEPSTVLSAIRVALTGSRFLDPGLSDTVIEELDIFPQVSRRSRDVLTPRETEVLERIVWGHTNSEIAAELCIKTTSVNTYRIRLCEKLGLNSRAEMVCYGIAVGLLKTPPAARRPPGSVSEPDSPVAGRIGAHEQC